MDRPMLRGRGTRYQRWHEAIADFFAPKTCAVCGERGAWVCPWCAADYVAFSPVWCARCGLCPCRCAEIHDALTVVRSYGPYEGWVGASIRALKYDGETARADMLAELLIGPAQDAITALGANAIVVPVPLHRRRRRQRGYNQSELLAERLAQSLALSYDPHLLRRVRATRQQVGLSGSERRANVQGAFQSAPLPAGSLVLLVDDVMTTSTTLGECAVALRAAGVSLVGAVTIARASDTAADVADGRADGVSVR